MEYCNCVVSKHHYGRFRKVVACRHILPAFLVLIQMPFLVDSASSFFFFNVLKLLNRIGCLLLKRIISQYSKGKLF